MKTTRQITLDNGVHHATIWARRSDCPRLLALHGFSGFGGDFDALATCLDRSIIAPDLLGHGLSAAPTGSEHYDIQRVARQAIAWLEPGERVFMLGYSMGGRVALRAASLLGDRLAGLILVSTHPGIEDENLRSARAQADSDLAHRIETLGIEWFCKHWADQPLIRPQQELPSDIRNPMVQARLTQRPHGLAESLRGMGQGAVTPVWDTLPHQPTLIITGDNDPRYTEIGARMCQTMNQATHLRAAAAGHCAHLENVPCVANAIRSFMESPISSSQ
jgi:2-succinyl-6-hydroxy-2,4-cyclohexadiene-1-carboxylate synthase